jgi:hypothetical protein
MTSAIRVEETTVPASITERKWICGACNQVFTWEYAARCHYYREHVEPGLVTVEYVDLNNDILRFMYIETPDTFQAWAYENCIRPDSFTGPGWYTRQSINDDPDWNDEPTFVAVKAEELLAQHAAKAKQLGQEIERLSRAMMGWEEC